jgi:hypothetical protein
MARRFIPSSFAILIMIMTGCGPSYINVSGTVFLDDKPIEGASVTFIPDGPGQPAVGTTDASGRYSLETNNTNGLLAGSFKVVVQKIAFTPYDERTGTGGKPLPSPIPKKFGLPETSGITMTVPSSDGLYDIRISSK